MKEPKPECICPYCCKPVYGDKFFCKPCKIELDRCPSCGGLKRKEVKVCSVCEKKGKK